MFLHNIQEGMERIGLKESETSVMLCLQFCCHLKLKGTNYWSIVYEHEMIEFIITIEHTCSIFIQQSNIIKYMFVLFYVINVVVMHVDDIMKWFKIKK